MLFACFFSVLAISLGVAYLAGSKKKDYFLANRSIGAIVLAGSLLGAQLGGGFILGCTELSFSTGIFGGAYGFSIALGTLCFALGYGMLMRKTQCTTIGDLLAKKYGCVGLKRLGTIGSVLSCAGGLMAQAIGLRGFLYAIGAQSDYLFFIAWIVTLVYTTYGGFLAVVWTDALQAFVMILLLFLIAAFVIVPEISTITAVLPSFEYTLTSREIGSFMIPFCFMFIQPDILQRCFAGASSKDVRQACLISAVFFALLVCIPIACGIIAKGHNIQIANGDIFIQVLKHSSYPMLFFAGATVVLLAIISTASSIALVISTSICYDLQIKAGSYRVVTALVGLLAALGPYIYESILQCLLACFEISVGLLFVPVVAAVLLPARFLDTRSACVSAVVGTVFVLVGRVLDIPQLSYISAVCISPASYFVTFLFRKEKIHQAA